MDEKELSREEIEKKIEAIRSRNLIYIFNTDRMPANPCQRELISSWSNLKKKVFTFTGSNKLGKTTIGTVIALCVMEGYWLWDREKKPIWPFTLPMQIRYIGQDWENHVKRVVQKAILKWIPKDLEYKTSKNNQGVINYFESKQTGSTMELMSNKQETDVFEGWDGHLIIYDEPPKRDIRVACARGLTVTEGRELFTATLLKEAWIHREVIKAKNEDGTADLSVCNIHGVIEDNLGYGLTQAGIDQFAKTLKPHEKKARLKGIPSYMGSLILPEFNRDIHIKEIEKIPLDWIVDIHIDFHPSKPWAIFFLATDCRNFKYGIFEISRHGSWKAIAEDIIRIIKKNDLRINYIIIDPLAKGDPQSDLNEESVYEKMRAYFHPFGYDLRTASKDKEGGILMIQDLLMTENEMPALFFRSVLVKTIQEVEDWMRDENGDPSKEDDDMVEGLYRTILLDTQYEPMNNDFEEDSYELVEPVSPVTRI